MTFLVKKFLCRKKFFRTPPENFFGPGPGPAPPPPDPVGGPKRSVGVSNPSKTVGKPQNTWKSGVDLPCNSSSRQSYGQVGTVLGVLARFVAGWGAAHPPTVRILF